MNGALYNEFDAFPADWLRGLIAAGHIAPGDVDERSITDLRPTDVRGRTQFHAFAGIGVWSHALRLAGWPDDRPIWTGSCPCQPFSAAGRRRGTADARHLWPEWFRLLRECRPPVVFGEQVASAIGHGWLDLVCRDLEGEGYAVGAAVLGAHSVGAPHRRQRLYFVADAQDAHRRRPGCSDDAGRWPAEVGGSGAPLRADDGDGRESPWSDLVWLPCRDGKARPTESRLLPLADGSADLLGYVRDGDSETATLSPLIGATPNRVGRLRGYGNAIVAPLAATFIRAVMDTLDVRAPAPHPGRTA